MQKKIIGLFFILVGVFLFLSNFNVLKFDVTMRYLWPLTLMLIGIVGIIEKKDVDVIYLIVFLFGLNSILRTLEIIDKNIIGSIFWPLIIVLIGYNLVFKQYSPSKKRRKSKLYSSLFGSITEKNDDKDFTHCDIITVFGGGEIDFSNIKLKEDKGYINITTFFGGVELVLPKEYKVSLSGIPIFGGCENKLSTSTKKGDKELIINYTVIFGGINIRN